VDSRPTTAVIGGGTMGAGIAHVLLAAGSPVVLVEADAARVDAARQAVEASVDGAEKRGKLP
jgi:3-hydroxybutyryl-CoA dehydrogenase